MRGEHHIFHFAQRGRYLRLIAKHIERSTGDRAVAQRCDQRVFIDDRAARTDEYVEILRRVWREPATRHDGTFARFAEVQSYPKPAQADGPPIHVGGHSLAAARRAGRIGDGFFPGRDLDTLVPAMRSAAEAAGRDPSSIVISAGGKPDIATVEHYRDTYGVQRFLVPPLGADVARVRANLDKFADRVIARL